MIYMLANQKAVSLNLHRYNTGTGAYVPGAGYQQGGAAPAAAAAGGGLKFVPMKKCLFFDTAGRCTLNSKY
jgi:hypothetical protein